MTGALVPLIIAGAGGFERVVQYSDKCYRMKRNTSVSGFAILVLK